MLGWSLAALEIGWSAGKLALITASLVSGVCLFFGVMVLQATLAFWTTESLEVMNILTYGGVELGQYPLPIYRPWWRRFFTGVVPVACANYFPLLTVLGRPDPLGFPALAGWLSPLAGLLFLLVSLRLFAIGERHYTSTGS